MESTKIPVKSGKNWAIQKKEDDSWKIVGRPTTKEKVNASIRAREATTHGAKMRK